MKLIVDGAEAQVQGEAKKICHEVGCQIVELEKCTPASNQVERTIQELKMETRRDMKLSGFPLVFWCYCMERRSEIIACCSRNNYTLDRQVPRTFITGEVTDISQIFNFKWYEWVKFRRIGPEAAYPFPNEHLGRCLGPVRNKGNMMSQYVHRRKKDDDGPQYDDDENGLQIDEEDEDRHILKDVDEYKDFDAYIGAEVLLPQNGDVRNAVKVIGRPVDDTGSSIGHYKSNPIKKLDSAVEKSKGLVQSKNGQLKPRITIKGWEFLIKWKDDMQSWMPMIDIKESSCSEKKRPDYILCQCKSEKEDNEIWDIGSYYGGRGI